MTDDLVLVRHAVAPVHDLGAAVEDAVVVAHRDALELLALRRLQQQRPLRLLGRQLWGGSIVSLVTEVSLYLVTEVSLYLLGRQLWGGSIVSGGLLQWFHAVVTQSSILSGGLLQ